MIRSRGVVLIFCLVAVPVTGSVRARDLAFVDRVECQEAIERVYYAHQIGATRPFEEALPRNVLERKVTTYLKQSVALERFWTTPVTAEMLGRETERMMRRTRMPGRLRQIFGALGNDPFLVQECLARPVLVDRLTRNFYAFDVRFHARAREEAGRLRADLLRAGIEGSGEDPRRSVLEFVEAPARGAWRRLSEHDARSLELTPDSYQQTRAAAPQVVGEFGPIQEERNAFRIRVLLEEGKDRFRLATFTVGKRSWDEWWTEVSRTLDESPVDAPTTALFSVTPVSSATSDGDRDDSIGRFDPGSPPTPCFPDDTWNHASLDDLLEPRQRHSAVWTGSEMIVWGGLNGRYLDSGGRYDPATDTWTSMSTVGAPAARYNHTAVWTGGRMLIWGGFGGPYFDTGASYDPVTDSWTPMSTTGAPAGRAYHTAVWTGKVMIMWGGTAGDFVYHDSGGIYDPDRDSWSPTSTIGSPTARTSHTAVWTGNRMIVWGGKGTIAAGLELNTGGIYDPTTDTWSPTSVVGAPADRSSHTAVWTGTRMIVWGGLEATYRESGGVYDPVTDTWTPTSLGNAPTARMVHTAVWTGDRMIIWGGIGASVADRDGGYDPQTDTWTPISTLGAPATRSFHTALWTGHLMIVWGGNGTNTGGRYDPIADNWTPTSMVGLPTPRVSPTAVWTGNEMIVWGGFSGERLATGARYNPAIDAWTPTPTVGAPSGRSDHRAVWTGKEMLVWGGYDTSPSLSNQGGRYDPAMDAWTPMSVDGAPTHRRGHSLIWTGRLAIVWGGQLTSGDTDSGGRYDPEHDRWMPTALTGAPAARAYHTAIWTGQRMVVWGGSSNNVRTETGGRYDPVMDVWEPTSTMNAPPGQVNHTAVWTGKEMIVWGGGGSLGSTNRGGRYDPTADSWMPTALTGAPTIRWGHTAVWTGSVMIVWGGQADLGSWVNTGARYDPVRDLWTPTSTANAPAARSLHTAVWTSSEMIIWGGGDGGLFNSGGRYALGHGTDDDRDGFSECSGDCNDGNDAMSPGAIEICDGLDNDCDGLADNASPPSEIPFVTMQPAGDATFLSWSPISAATGYDLVRGSLSSLSEGGGDYGSATDACIVNDLPDTTAVLDVDPPSGQGFWYLVRPTNCGGSGSYDSGGSGQVGTRDAGIAVSGFSCP